MKLKVKLSQIIMQIQIFAVCVVMDILLYQLQFFVDCTTLCIKNAFIVKHHLA